MEEKRYDSVVAKTFLLNYSIGPLENFGVKLNDFNCGLKAYKNIVIKNIEVSGEMHRYIPVLAKMLVLEKLVKSRDSSSEKIRKF